MGTYDDPIGALLIGTWVSSLLEMLIITNTIEYYTNFPKDSLFKKIFIGAVVVVDFISLVSAYITVYLVCVTFWGDEVAIQKQFWSIPMCLASTGLVTIFSQGFLIYRVWILSKNWLIMILLSLGALAAMACVTTAAGFFGTYREYSERHRASVAVIVWLATTTATDIGITGVLIFWLYNMKTTFKHTENIIRRLIRVAVQTGSASSLIAIGVLISYIINDASNIESGITFVLSRTYVLTLLYNVNVRSSNQALLMPSHGTSDLERASAPVVSFSEIHVHRTAHVHIDEDYPMKPSTRKTVTAFNHDDLGSNKIENEIDTESDQASQPKQ
ncbi:hypothetical protein E1B28_003081 [Marasmius oreades]|uniref:DUF6534 domain-containing protein n=1 Tax=Marasmius oreades TaxID=181124 RepID=A0A9P7RLP1_9AGAR|nr:uncharacterized protein E1B28_003081 [Marasmius oreades]KAG7085521.1 hypothetical protein E1B28_003081 [Marasmius oreades]